MTFAGYLRNERALKVSKKTPPREALVRSPDDFSGLDDALQEMREAGVERLIIDGGDGTVREATRRAISIWQGAPPEFAVVPSGNTNLVARHAGKARNPNALARRDTPVRQRRLRIMNIDRPGAESLSGFIMGAGAYLDATKDAQAKLRARHGRQVAMAVLRILTNKKLRGGVSAKADFGAGPLEKRRLLLAMTSLPSPLFLRIDPFWEGSDLPLRWLDIDADAKRPVLAAPLIAAGRPMRWMKDAYRSGCADRVEITLEGDFVLDGEIFSPGEDGKIIVDATRTLTFVSA